MTNSKASKEKLSYYTSLGINTDSKYFRRHYRRGLLNEIDIDYVKEIQEYYRKHLNRTIDPVTHIAYANLTGMKDVRIIPQEFFRKDILKMFNDYLMTDIYRDKALYDLMFDTEKQAYTVIKRVRGQYYNHDNVTISVSEVFNILNDDSEEYIIKPTDTNNGIGIKKIKVENRKLYIDDNLVTKDFLDSEYGYNFVVQRIIKQHENLAYPHPSSVNTLRMVTIRWKNKIENLYTFARFGHSGDIKDNAGSGGVVVGVKDDGSFMDYGIQASKFIYEHPTTKIKISELKNVPNFEEAKKFVRELHSKVLHHNYVAWDITIDENGNPVFIEANFFGSSWVNQIALQEPMFRCKTEEILEFIAENREKVNQLDIKSLAKKRNSRARRERRKLSERVEELEQKLVIKKEKLKKLKKINRLNKEEIKRIKNSKSWRYTQIFRKI